MTAVPPATPAPDAGATTAPDPGAGPARGAPPAGPSAEGQASADAPVPDSAAGAGYPTGAVPAPGSGASGEDVAGRAAELSGAAVAGAGLPDDAPPLPAGSPARPADSVAGGTAAGSGTVAPGAEPGMEDVPVRDALRVAQLDDEVVVLDGQPRYHLTGCAALPVGPQPVPLAVSVARRAGFTPCAVCTPDRILLARALDRRPRPR